MPPTCETGTKNTSHSDSRDPNCATATELKLSGMEQIRSTLQLSILELLIQSMAGPASKPEPIEKRRASLYDEEPDMSFLPL